MALQTPLLLRSCPLRRPIASFILLTVTTQKCGVPPRAARFIEIKHLIDGAGDRIKTPLANALSAEPVILDEPKHRRLVGCRVVYEILQRPWRYDQQWLARPITTAAERVGVGSVNAGQRVACRATCIGARKRVRRTCGLVYEWSHLMVVPTVGVIVQDDHRRALP